MENQCHKGSHAIRWMHCREEFADGGSKQFFALQEMRFVLPVKFCVAIQEDLQPQQKMFQKYPHQF